MGLKKFVKKVTGGAKKAVRKIVPKEVAGIMQVAAPFVAPYSLPGALALSLGGQLRQGEGRISPFKTLMAIAPSEQFRGFTRGLPGGTSLDQALYGTGVTYGGPMGSTEIAATQGLIGTGGEFGLGQFMKGSLLSPGGELSKARVAGLVAAGASLATTKQEIEEEGEESGLSSGEIARLQAEAEEMWQDFDTTAFRPKITAAIGGLMRKNLANGTFFPKPKPEDYGIEDNELPADPKPFRPKPNVGNKAKITAEIMAQEYFGMSFNNLSPEQQQGILELIGASKPQAQQGGLMRANYALGSMPTKEESGLGGLPIEADMRYTGGFMPYGAKEKADDVPARLSKNEFVFTADAVRAAGGGSVQKGAQKMYNTMKQLESMGKMA